MHTTADQITAWLDYETGYRGLEVEPLETTEQRNARLIATANMQPLPADAIPLYVVQPRGVSRE